MVQVTFRQHPVADIMQLSAIGHADYAEKGKDIVCAAVSCIMQMLAYSIEDGEYMDNGAEGVTVQACGGDANYAKFEMAVDGMRLLAGAYPGHVSFRDASYEEDELDLQRFAEGGGDGGDGGADAGGSTEGGEAAVSAPEMPKLRPAEERLARRSGVLKRTAAAESKATAADGKQYGEGKAEKGEEKADGEPEEKEPKDKAGDKQAHQQAFRDLLMGEYREETEQLMQRAVEEAQRRLEVNPQMRELMEALSEAYGVEPKDIASLTEAVRNGQVKNEEYFENLAMEKGVSVATAKQMDKLEAENKRLTAAQQIAAQQQEAAKRQAEIAQIHAQWDREAAQLKNEYPNFNLQAVLANPEVAKLMRLGVSMPNAYRSVYFDEIMADRTAATAKQVERGVTARIQQRGNRAGENGTRPGGAVQTAINLDNMTRKEREALERRALHGEKITFKI